MNRTSISAILFVSFVGCSSWAPRVWTTSEERLEFSSSSLVSVSARTENGDLAFLAEETPSRVQVSVTKAGGGWDLEDAQRCLDAIGVETRETDGTLELGWRWRRDRRSSWQARVSFEVLLPRDLEVVALTHNGKVELAGLASRGDIESHNGALTARRHRGELHAETHNGAVVVREHAGDLDVESHNGRIEVEGVISTLELQTHNGAIEADLRGSGVVNGHVVTHNGRISLRAGEQASFRVTCSTANGSIRAGSGLTVEKASRRELVARTGAGEGALVLSTDNGSIDLGH